MAMRIVPKDRAEALLQLGVEVVKLLRRPIDTWDGVHLAELATDLYEELFGTILHAPELHALARQVRDASKYLHSMALQRAEALKIATEEAEQERAN